MSYGQDLCKAYLQRLVPEMAMENHRPDWLHGMELDFYFPSAKVAIEFNGDQHYFATGLSADPMPQKQRDARKKAICKERGITLISLKAIDLVSHKMRFRLKRHFELQPNGNIKGLDHEAKEYRKMLIQKYNSPTAHRNKGRMREKTVAKLFEQHPPKLDGRWNQDVFLFKLKEWQRQHGKTQQALVAFVDTYGKHLRKRHLRKLGMHGQQPLAKAPQAG